MLGFGAFGQFALGQPSPNPLFAPPGSGRSPASYVPQPPRGRRAPPFRRLQVLDKPQAVVEGPPPTPPPLAAPSLPAPPSLETAPMAQTTAEIASAQEAQEIVDVLMALIASGEL